MKYSWKKPLPEFPINRTNTALLIIDMQYLDSHWDYGELRKARDAGFESQLLYYKQRLEYIVPNIRKLQDVFREKGMEVLHTRIQSLTMDGRDRCLQHKNIQIHAAPNSKEAQILEELLPKGDEIVFSKTSGSVFTSTNIDYVLRNLGIECLVVVGVVTSGCVDSSTRDASERSYYPIVVEDACGAYTKELHEGSIRALSEVYAKIKTTEELLEIIKHLQKA